MEQPVRRARMLDSLMRRAFLVAVLAACSSPPAPVAPVTPPPATPMVARPTLAGTYREPHEIKMVCDGDEGWCDEKVEDVLEIRAAADGALAITVELVQTNAHTCGFEGTLVPSTSTVPGTRVWRYQAVVPDGEDAEAEACTLDLAADATSITLSAEGCREHCGMRAHLDAYFSRAAR